MWAAAAVFSPPSSCAAKPTNTNRSKIVYFENKDPIFTLKWLPYRRQILHFNETATVSVSCSASSEDSFLDQNQDFSNVSCCRSLPNVVKYFIFPTLFDSILCLFFSNTRSLIYQESGKERVLAKMEGNLSLSLVEKHV